jgi:hypothetical protein
VINIWYMCKKTGESVDHFLLHCDVTSALWITLFSRFGMSWLCLDGLSTSLLVGGPLEG